jgi:peptide/nickel transport system ATP-binding protein
MKRGKEKTLFSIKGEPPDLLGTIVGCSFAPRCPYAKQICREKNPEGKLVDGRVVECHFAKEMTGISGRELYKAYGENLFIDEIPNRTILGVKNLRKLFPVSAGLLASLSRKQNFVRAVDGISFDVKEAEIFALVGESGCGKTTTGKCIVKPYDITEGKISLLGDEITALKKKDFSKYRRDIQMIFQDPYAALDPRQTVYGAIAEPLRIHHITKNRTEERKKVASLLRLLKLVPPEDYMGSFPHQLSGGERQRVVVAKVMALNPKVIIADEPVSMLDVSVRAGILDILLELRKKFDVSIVFITHDLAVASYLADRIATMYLGEIVEMGPSEIVVNNPIHPYTQALINSVPSIDDIGKERKRAQVIGEPPSPINPPSGCRFHPRCPLTKSECKTKTPELFEIGKNHYVACHKNK